MMRTVCVLLLALPLFGQTNIDRGIAVELDVVPHVLHDGDTIHVAFSVRDETTRTPFTGARPAAWLARRGSDCAANAARFIGGALNDRAPVDFNNYYVLALNDDASISVVDPRFSFGGSQLLAMVPLEARGEDWALDGSTLYVTMPSVGNVAIVDTETWKVRTTVPVPGASRVVVHEGEAWIVGDGVTVLDGGRVVSRARGRAVVVADRKVLISTSEIAAWSSAAQLLYVADSATGKIIALRANKPVATIKATPGFTQLKFAGRYGFLPNPNANIVEIIDASSNRIVQTADVGDGPDQVTFTDRLAFIRRRNSDGVMMIPLQRIGASDSIGLADFTGGQHALGAGKFTALADSIVEAPDGPAVLVANPADRSIYYYKEGMAAPMGGFSNGSREPRAVLVVDRSLREQKNGVYATSAKVEEAGKYDVVFFLDSPRVVTCFPLEVTERDETKAKRVHAAVVEPLSEIAHARAGAATRIRFRIADASTHVTRSAGDVEVVVMEAPGVWQRRTTAAPSQDGTYEVEITPPSAGTYYAWVASAAAGLPLNNPYFIRFEVD